jgi:hypothetical protein
MRETAGIVLALLVMGCAGTAPRPVASLPATDRDPLPFTPPPEPRGRTGETVALAAVGGEDQARRMLPELLVAVQAGDPRALETLLAEELVLLQNRDAVARPREAVVDRIVRATQRASMPPDAPVEELVDLASVRVSRAAQAFAGRGLPPGIRATDVVVEVPLLDAGRIILRMLLGWHHEGRMIVRPGRDARIVGL